MEAAEAADQPTPLGRLGPRGKTGDEQLEVNSAAEAEDVDVIDEASGMSAKDALKYVRTTLRETAEKLEQERAQRGASEMTLEVLREEFQRLAATCRMTENKLSSSLGQQECLERELKSYRETNPRRGCENWYDALRRLEAENAKLREYTRQARESQKEQAD